MAAGELLRLAFAAALGLCAGSFLGTCIERVPRGLSVLRPRSRCEGCGAPLGPAELVPVLSYLLQRGRCRRCGAAIGAGHLLAELGAAALAVAAYLQEGLSPEFFRTFGLACVFLAVAAVDLRHRIIPDGFVVAGLLAAFLGAPLPGPPTLLGAGLGLIAGGGGFFLVREAYRRLRGREGMGAGDVKLAALMGAALGPGGWLAAVVLASAAGTAVGLGLVLAGRATWTSALPFGAFLAGASLLMLFCLPCLFFFSSSFQ